MLNTEIKLLKIRKTFCRTLNYTHVDVYFLLFSPKLIFSEFPNSTLRPKSPSSFVIKINIAYKLSNRPSLTFCRGYQINVRKGMQETVALGAFVFALFKFSDSFLLPPFNGGCGFQFQWPFATWPWPSSC